MLVLESSQHVIPLFKLFCFRQQINLILCSKITYVSVSSVIKRRLPWTVIFLHVFFVPSFLKHKACVNKLFSFVNTTSYHEAVSVLINLNRTNSSFEKTTRQKNRCLDSSLSSTVVPD